MSGEIRDWSNGLGKRYRSDGTHVYVARWSDRHGQKRTETFPDGTSYKDAKARRAERVRESRLGFTHGAETVSEFVAETFLPSKRRKLRESSYRRYGEAWRLHLEPVFGRMRLRDVRASHVQEFVDRSQQHPRTLRQTLTVLSQILKAASVRDKAQPVDFRSLELPALPASSYGVITLPQVYELAEMIGDWYAPDIIFLAVTGLRYGEYAALDDTDVDLKAARLRVSKSLDPWGNVNPPKTAAGDRVIDLHPPALEAVKAKRLLKLEHGLAASPALFPASRGGRADHGYFHRYEWKPSIAALGWKLKIHDLRHTAASLMIRFGANEFYVMEQLGHANIAVTMGVYTHMFREHKAEIRDRIDDAYREAMA